jgi:hypothetical protein
MSRIMELERISREADEKRPGRHKKRLNKHEKRQQKG